MKNVLKRSLSVFLAITIVFSSAYVGLGEIDFSGIFAVKANAASVDDLTFELNDDGVSYSVTNCSESASGGLVIPDTYNGKPVTNIGYEAFKDCTSLTSITIPDSVTSIGSYAFSDCTSLTSVTIGDGVTTMGGDVFYNTAYYNDKSNWSNGILYIDNYFIEADKDLFGSYEIKCGTRAIAGGAFRNCTSLTAITIPDSVTSIGNSAFSGCTSLTAITIPDSVTSIGHSAFYSCTSLTSINIPNSVTSIDPYAFYYCTSLASISIGDSVTSIGVSAFYYCKSLTSVTIPDSVTSIGVYAFRDCTSLTSVAIGNSVTSIWDWAFEGCYNLSEVVTPCNSYACTYFKASILKLTHTLSSDWVVTKEATCTESGTKTKTCSACGYVVTEAIEALGHDYSTEWTIEKEATCTEEGVKYRYCSRCGDKTDVTIIPVSKTNHNYSDWIVEKEATCEAVGKRVRLCVDCGGTFYEFIPATGHTESDWIVKKATVNAAGKKYKECTDCGKVLEKIVLPQLKCSKPTIKAIANKDYGVRFEWGKVSGADSYKVYRKVSGGSYKYLGKTTKTAYADKTAKSGKKYYYVVKAVNEAGSSEKSASKSITFVDAPTIKTPSSAKSGITVKWSKVSGAEGYIVYRKTGSGSYAKLAKVKSGTKVSYLDKSAKKGKTYSYKIEAYKGSTKSAASAVKTIKDKY